MKFKIGDRIKYIGTSDDSAFTPRYGGRYGRMLGTVLAEYTGKFRIRYDCGDSFIILKVHWDNGNENGYPDGWLNEFVIEERQLRLF
uniref:Uncharacterized protein n=1 Tax=viral metagenome TaxID=1070528 RepID=A0A6H1ZT24_9ZZZZ